MKNISIKSMHSALLYCFIKCSPNSVHPIFNYFICTYIYFLYIFIYFLAVHLKPFCERGTICFIKDFTYLLKGLQTGWTEELLLILLKQEPDKTKWEDRVRRQDHIYTRYVNKMIQKAQEARHSRTVTSYRIICIQKRRKNNTVIRTVPEKFGHSVLCSSCLKINDGLLFLFT